MREDKEALDMNKMNMVSHNNKRAFSVTVYSANKEVEKGMQS